MLCQVSLSKRMSVGAVVIQLSSGFSSEKSKDTATETHRIPEIHILLTRDIKDTTELG